MISLRVGCNLRTPGGETLSGSHAPEASMPPLPGDSFSVNDTVTVHFPTTGIPDQLPPKKEGAGLASWPRPHRSEEQSPQHLKKKTNMLRLLPRPLPPPPPP